MNALSLFSGIGGFDLAFERAGFDVIGQVEIDAFANRVLAQHWPTVPRFNDVRILTAADVGHVDVLVGGFPCQDVSVAGKREGLDGARSGLFFEFMRIAGELQPEWVVIENVPGLFSSRNGRDVSAVIEALRERGYLDGAYRFLDSRYFGVAQRRRRTFFVGHLGNGTRAASVLFEPASRGGHPSAGHEAGPRVAATLRGRSHGAGVNATGRGGEDDQNLVCNSITPGSGSVGSRGFDDGANIVATGINVSGLRGRQPGSAATFVTSHALTSSRSGMRFDPNGETYVTAFNWQSGGDCRLGPFDGRTDALHAGQTPAVAFGLRASDGHHGHSSPRGDGCDNLVPIDFRQTSRGEKSTNRRSHGSGGPPGVGVGREGDPAFTVSGRQQGIGGTGGVRRLTPLECERLQAFPDGWTCLCGCDPYSTAACRCPDSPRYKTLGNAVTVSVVEWIARRLLTEMVEHSAEGAA